jgi:hypothetical protein
VNSIGYVNGDGRDYLIAVLTSANTTEAQGIETVEGLSKLAWQELAPRAWAADPVDAGPPEEAASSGRTLWMVTEADKHWAAAGGALMVAGVVCGGFMAATAKSLSNLGWNTVFDACGVAVILGLGVMVSAVAIDGLVDRQHVVVVPLQTHGAVSGGTVSGANEVAPTLEIRQLFVNQQRNGAYRARYELTVHARGAVTGLRVEGRAPSIVRVVMTSDSPVQECDAGTEAAVAWSSVANPPDHLHLDVWTAEPEPEIVIVGSIA